MCDELPTFKSEMGLIRLYGCVVVFMTPNRNLSKWTMLLDSTPITGQTWDLDILPSLKTGGGSLLDLRFRLQPHNSFDCS